VRRGEGKRLIVSSLLCPGRSDREGWCWPGAHIACTRGPGAHICGRQGVLQTHGSLCALHSFMSSAEQGALHCTPLLHLMALFAKRLLGTEAELKAVAETFGPQRCRAALGRACRCRKDSVILVRARIGIGCSLYIFRPSQVLVSDWAPMRASPISA